MVNYSPRAARALSFLKQPYNDIDIFVEDTGNHNMWLVMLRQILPARIKLSSVSLLGGRDRVEEACRLDQADTGRKKLYIIDGDFDYLHGNAKVRLKHLYRLRSYCVENLLIHEHALIQSALTLEPMMKERKIRDKIDFDKWTSAEFDKLSPLFVVYAAVRKLMPSVQTVSYAVNNLIRATPSGQVVCETKVRNRILYLMRILYRKFGVSIVRPEINRIKNSRAILDHNKSISGKDYLLPLVWMRMKWLFSYRGTHEQFKVMLAQFWLPEREAFFRRRLLRVAGA